MLPLNNYYPFGLKHKGYNDNVSAFNNGVASRWKFGGKEYNEELGLDWYDIQARNYQPDLGRWMNLDPLAEVMRRHSPYNYAFDNPIYFFDPDGMMPQGSCCGGIGDAFRGIWNTVKGEVVGTVNFITTDAWQADTWKGLGNLALGAVASANPIGGGPNYANLYAIDNALGTNTTGAIEGLTQSLDEFGDNLANGNTEQRASAITSLALAFLPTKLDDVSKLSKTAQLGKLSGIAKNAKWSRASQKIDGPGIRDHFDKHGADIGVESVRDYDISARNTIQDGRKFSYKDRATGDARTGYYNSETGLFTATSKSGKNTVIHTHFRESWDNLKKLPGFSN